MLIFYNKYDGFVCGYLFLIYTMLLPTRRLQRTDMDNTQATPSQITITSGAQNQNIQKWLLMLGMPFLFCAIAFLMVSLSLVNKKNDVLVQQIHMVSVKQAQMYVLSEKLDALRESSEEMGVSLSEKIYNIAMIQEEIALAQLAQEMKLLVQGKSFQKLEGDFKNFRTPVKDMVREELKNYMVKLEKDVGVVNFHPVK